MRDREYRIGPGASSLLLILLALVLTVLGMLALLSARADRTLSQRARDMTKAYYDARALSQERLMEIDQILGEAESSGADGYFAAVAGALPEWAALSGRTIAFSQDAGGERSIRVTILLNEPGSGGARYEITECALIDEMQWKQEILNLM